MENLSLEVTFQFVFKSSTTSWMQFRCISTVLPCSVDMDKQFLVEYGIIWYFEVVKLHGEVFQWFSYHNYVCNEACYSTELGTVRLFLGSTTLCNVSSHVDRDVDYIQDLAEVVKIQFQSSWNIILIHEIYNLKMGIIIWDHGTSSSIMSLIHEVCD